MRKLVLEGLQFTLPDVVLEPFRNADKALGRITAFPSEGWQGVPGDPVKAARALLRVAQDKGATRVVATPSSESSKPNAVETASDASLTLAEMGEAVIAQMALLTADERAVRKLASSIKPNPASRISRAVGDAFCRLASNEQRAKRHDKSISFMEEAKRYGVTNEWRPWLSVLWGNSFFEQAKIKAKTKEGNESLSLALESYANAVQYKPDLHEAYFNWGIVLAEMARVADDPKEADNLFDQAAQKYAESLRIKPDKYEALNNWGNALWNRAKLKGDTPEADFLFDLAYRKFGEAMQLKPDAHELLLNWGTALNAQAWLKRDTPKANELCIQAQEKFSAAACIKPDRYDVFVNWATALTNQAKLKDNSSVANALLAEAERKYREAVRIKPDVYEAIFGWGYVLMETGRLRENRTEVEVLLDQAREKYLEAARLRPTDFTVHFNLACLAGFLGDAPKCCEALAIWAKTNPKAQKRNLDLDSDFDRVRDNPQFQAFRAQIPD